MPEVFPGDEHAAFNAAPSGGLHGLDANVAALNAPLHQRCIAPLAVPPLDTGIVQSRRKLCSRLEHSATMGAYLFYPFHGMLGSGYAR